MNKLLVILGPTSAGKTKLALTLAKKFKGELISADSRQIYHGLDIGTGKDIGNAQFHQELTPVSLNTKSPHRLGYYSLSGIPLWLLDIVDPEVLYTAAHFVLDAQLVIKNISQRGKLPILVGGTGFYIKALIQGISTFGIPPDQKLRDILAADSLIELQAKLKEVAPRKYQQLNNSDINNKRRLVRAIEIALAKKPNRQPHPNYHPLAIGLNVNKGLLARSIASRINKRLKQGLLKEIKSLLAKGVKWSDPAMSAIGYKQWHEYFAGKSSLSESLNKWQKAEIDYAKRQMVFFRKIDKVVWYDKNDHYPLSEIESKVKVFLNG